MSFLSLLLLLQQCKSEEALCTNSCRVVHVCRVGCLLIGCAPHLGRPLLTPASPVQVATTNLHPSTFVPELCTILVYTLGSCDQPLLQLLCQAPAVHTLYITLQPRSVGTFAFSGGLGGWVGRLMTERVGYQHGHRHQVAHACAVSVCLRSH